MRSRKPSSQPPLPLQSPADTVSERIDKLEGQLRRLWALVQANPKGSPPGSDPPSVAPRFLRIDAGPKLQEVLDLLTPRERQVLRLFAESHSDKRIARTLGTQVQTVRNQIASISKKLHAASREQLLSLILNAHLLDDMGE